MAKSPIFVLSPADYSRVGMFLSAWQSIMCRTGNVAAANQWWDAAARITNERGVRD